MPDNENDLSGKVSLDITNFKANIAQLNQQIKVVETGFKAAAAGMEDWGASEEGLQLRLKALNDIINLQKQKVENLKEQYIKIAAEKGETSKAARDLQIKINNETAALNKNQAELQSTTNKLKNFGKESEEASKKTSLFTKIFSGAFWANIASNALNAIGNKLKEFASAALETADNLVKMSDVTGLSTDRLQELQYVGDDLGVSLDTISGAQKKLTKSMSEAKQGTADYVAAFKTLKVDAFDPVTGALRDSNTVMMEVIDALGKVENETERDALAMQVFGKSAMELNPLIKAGSAGLKDLSEQAHESGAVMSEEAVSALDTLGDTFDHVKQSVTSFIGEGLAKLIDSTESVADVSNKIASTDQTIELISRYNNLKVAVSDTSLSAEELAQKTTELAEVKQQLIEASGGVVTSANEETGAFDKQVESFEKMTAAQMELYQLELRSKAQAGTSVYVEKQRAELQEKQVQLEQRYIEEKQRRIDLEIQLEKMDPKKDAEEMADLGGKIEALKTGEDMLSSSVSNNSKKLEENNAKADEAEQAIRLLVKSGMTEKEVATAVGISVERVTKITQESTETTEDASSAVKDLTVSEKKLDPAVEAVNKQIADAKDATEKLSGATSTLISETKSCADAFAEQNESGSISLDTAQKMIAAGYATALSIDAESGKVTLNAASYEMLAKAKINEQIATLEATKREASQKAIEAERQVALNAAAGFYDLAASQYAAAAAAKNEAITADANIKVLQSLKNTVGTVPHTVATSASRTTSTVKSSTDKNVEAFKKAVDDVQYQLDMGLISEDQYWKQFTSLQSRYLKKGSDEWQDANVKIHDQQKEKNKAILEESEETFDTLFDNLRTQYESGQIDFKKFLAGYDSARDKYLTANSEKWKSSYETLFELIKKTQSEKLQEIVNNYNSSLQDIENKQKTMAERLLSSTGGITESISFNNEDFVQLSNLDSQTQSIEAFGDALQALKDRGISASMLSEIAAMDVGEGTQTANLLLGLSDERWSKEMAAWDAKQKAAKAIAEAYYAEDVKTLEDTLKKAVTDLQSEMTISGTGLGKNLTDGLVKGITSGQLSVESAMTMIASAALDAAKKTLGVASPSKEMEKIGLFTDQGYAKGINNGSETIQSAVKDLLQDVLRQAGEARINANITSSFGSGVISNLTRRSAQPGTTQSESESLALVNAVISGVRMAMAPTGSGKQAEGSLLLDGVNAGRVLFPHIIEDARRRGMIDSNGYLKVGTK